MTAAADRVPPHDLEAEIAVLGSMLLERDAGVRVAAILTPDDFYRAHHADLFRVMVGMLADERPIDVVLLREELQRRGHLEAVGGAGFISRIVAAVPSAANAEYYARIVRSLARSRAGIKATDAIADLLWDGGEPAAISAAIEDLKSSLSENSAPTLRWDLAETFDEPDPPPPDEFVARVFVRPGVHIIFGPPQAGKSWAAMALCLDAVMGEGNFLGCENLYIKPLRDLRDGRRETCLWIYGSEDTRDRVRRRLRQLHASGPHAGTRVPRGCFYFATPPGGTPLSSSAGRRWLESEIRATSASIVVLDTVTSLCAGGMDVNKAEEVAPFLSWLHGLRDTCGLLLFLVHHTRKGPSDTRKATPSKADSLLGAGTWRSQADGVLLLDAKDGMTNDVAVVSIKAKDIDKPLPVFHATLDTATARFRPLLDDETPPAPEPLDRGGRPKKCSAEAVLRLRGEFPQGVPWNEIASHIGVSAGTWSNNSRAIQDDLLRLGHVVVHGVLRWSQDDEVVS